MAADLSDAADWSTAPALLNGAHLLTSPAVKAGDRYLQLRATLLRDADGTSPSLASVAVHVR
jgi:hypothetical protein